MVDLEAYDGIIFDMDGTLVDSMGGHMEAWRITCDQFSYPFDLDYMYGLGGVPTVKTAEMLNEKYNKDIDPLTVGSFKREVARSMDEMPVLIEDTLAIFNHYRPTKKIAVGTGAERKPAEALLEHHGILSKLDALVTSSDVTNGKPSGDTFLLAAKEMDIEPSKCVVFEDTEIGRQAAQNAGMDCILVIKGKVQA